MLGGRRTALAVYGTAAALVLLGASAYAYDSSRDDLIAKGVVVAGVDVGGLRADDARDVLRRSLGRRLDRPVSVYVAGRRFRLTPERAGLVVDVDRMVDDAIERARSDGLPTRVWRDITGGRVRAELPARVDYSPVAVRQFVRRVGRTVDRPARDAEVEFKTASLPAIPSQTGLRVDRRRLRAAVKTGLGRPTGRQARGRVRVVKPKITTAELAKKYPYVVTVDRPGYHLRFFKALKLEQTYKIAVGQAGLETPAGLYHVQNKAVNPSWHVPKSAWAGKLAGKVIPPGPDNPIKARWLGIFDGAGIHGTADVGSLGTSASHGCIRMAIPDVEELYDEVPVQTPVFIQ